jgi:hypothetical protein
VITNGHAISYEIKMCKSITKVKSLGIVCRGRLIRKARQLRNGPVIYWIAWCGRRIAGAGIVKDVGDEYDSVTVSATKETGLDGPGVFVGRELCWGGGDIMFRNSRTLCVANSAKSRWFGRDFPLRWRYTLNIKNKTTRGYGKTSEREKEAR